MCMHCGSPHAEVKKWAKYSGIAAGIQAIFYIALLVIDVAVISTAFGPITCSSNCDLCFSQSQCADQSQCTWDGSDCY